ncbi:MAG: hypothetical protein OEQ13_11240 [Acidobacteriota bacterium]|nr:hypothetical protein [Acidobacteriota bacterium]
MTRVARIVGLLALVIVTSLGAVVLVTPTEARGRCICPKIYAPVECKGGKIFSNQCVADCRNAKNCVPIGAI